MSTTTTQTVILQAQRRDAGTEVGEPHATSRALMSGKATQADRLAHIVQAVRDAGLAGNPTPTGEAPRVTPQQMEVLDLIAQGCSNTEIARALFKSVETVKSHQGNLYRRFGVAGRVELVIEAVRAGTIPSPAPAQRRPRRTRAAAAPEAPAE